MRRVNLGAPGASVHQRGGGALCTANKAATGAPTVRPGSREGRGPSYLAPTRPPGTRSLVGATHRSWDGNPLPLPGYEPLARIPGAPTNDNPSVQSPVAAAVSGLNDLTSQTPPTPGRRGGGKNTHALCGWPAPRRMRTSPHFPATGRRVCTGSP